MSLLNTHHSDPVSAALSIANARASKVAMLSRDGLHEAAERAAVTLMADVCGFIADGSLNGAYRGVSTAQLLTNTALATYQTARERKAKAEGGTT